MSTLHGKGKPSKGKRHHHSAALAEGDEHAGNEQSTKRPKDGEGSARPSLQYDGDEQGDGADQDSASLTAAQLRAKERDAIGDAHTLDSDDEEEEVQEELMEKFGPRSRGGRGANGSAAGRRRKRKGGARERRSKLARDVDNPNDDDSAEEEEEYRQNVEKNMLTEEDEEGLEKLDEDFDDGGYAVTGFNLNDELNDGHFDETGQFQFNKDKDAQADAWLDGVETYKGPVQSFPDEKAQQKEAAAFDRYEAYAEVLKLIKPGETVADAMRRLGGMAATPRSNNSKAKSRKQHQSSTGAKGRGPVSGDEASEKEARMKSQQDLDKLIELANALLDDGVASIYEDTYEGVDEQVKLKDVTTFEYKWSEDDDAEVYGPYAAEQMETWKAAGFFKSGVWAREAKKGSRARWYHSDRIDFDLYT